MGQQSTTTPSRLLVCLLLAAALLLAIAGANAQSANTQLILPAAVAYDSSGNLFFAESGRHIIRKLTPAGVLTIVAGTGTQGFAGDGGPATTACLDTPSGLAVDSSGNLFVADTHNHRIRRVDSATGVITTYAQAVLPVALAFSPRGTLLYADAATHQILNIDPATLLATAIAGNGTQGFAGDRGPATQASIDTPSGLAFDAAGDLFLADTHNHRIRRVDAVTAIISTVAGSGTPGFSGDAASATAAQLDLPRGLSVDASGNLYLADSSNHRIRRIDAITGIITTIAGDGTQAFLGDGTPAKTASLDTPRAVTLSPANLPTLADTANNRIRQLDASSHLQTIAGIGAVTPARLVSTTTLTQTSPQILTASVTSAGSPTGLVTLLDGTTPIASANLASGLATFSANILSNGSHTLSAAYAGDAADLPSVSSPLVVSTGPSAASTFSLASSGPSTLTVPAGTAATFAFTITPTGAPLSSAIALAVSGLPANATASFNPGYLPPLTGPVNFTLIVTTPSAQAQLRRQQGREATAPRLILAVLILPLVFARRRRGLTLLCLLFLAGCGDRINTNDAGKAPAVPYTLTINATATLPNGATLLQTTQVTLTLQ